MPPAEPSTNTVSPCRSAPRRANANTSSGNCPGARPLGIVDVVWRELQIGRGHNNPFRPPTQHREGRYAFARFELRLIRRRTHDAGDLHAWDERRVQPQLILAAQEQQVGEAHAGRTDVDDDDIVVADNILDVGERQT